MEKLHLNARVLTVKFNCQSCRTATAILCYYPETLQGLCDHCRALKQRAVLEKQRQKKNIAWKMNEVPLAVSTVNFKYYPKNNGNVSKARVDMFKRRRICPDGNGEVVMANQFGKITDRRAYNY